MSEVFYQSNERKNPLITSRVCSMKSADVSMAIWSSKFTKIWLGSSRSGRLTGVKVEIEDESALRTYTMLFLYLKAGIG